MEHLVSANKLQRLRRHGKQSPLLPTILHFACDGNLASLSDPNRLA